MATFSQRLKTMRMEMNLSLRQLSKLTDISPSALHSYEIDTRTPSHQSLEALADIFNCDIDYLLGKSDIKNPVYDVISLLQNVKKIEKSEIDIKTRDIDFMMLYHGESEDTQVRMHKLMQVVANLDADDQNAVLRLALALEKEP